MAGFSIGRGNVEKDILQEMSSLERQTTQLFSEIRPDRQNRQDQNEHVGVDVSAPKSSL